MGKRGTLFRRPAQAGHRDQETLREKEKKQRRRAAGLQKVLLNALGRGIRILLRKKKTSNVAKSRMRIQEPGPGNYFPTGGAFDIAHRKTAFSDQSFFCVKIQVFEKSRVKPTNRFEKKGSISEKKGGDRTW